MDNYQWCSIVSYVIFLIFLFVPSEKIDGDAIKKTLLIIVSLIVCVLLFKSTYISKNPLGIDMVPQGQTIEVLAVDTTNATYINLMTVDNDKNIYTYAVNRDLFDKIPEKKSKIFVIKLDGKRKIFILNK